MPLLPLPPIALGITRATLSAAFSSSPFAQHPPVQQWVPGTQHPAAQHAPLEMEQQPQGQHVAKAGHVSGPPQVLFSTGWN
mmetsp:Transcript_30930/g.100724  ORF Transcript_30930/g.100724 Transcript_30930/m.100724 type:complete len:81 (-) Transcript_30930:1523-1765(-)